jgi:hypothetical protein
LHESASRESIGLTLQIYHRYGTLGRLSFDIPACSSAQVNEDASRISDLKSIIKNS